MNKQSQKLLAAGSLTLLTQLSTAKPIEFSINLSTAQKKGLSVKSIEQAYQYIYNIDLDWDEALKVTINEEGSLFQFDTLDSLSVIIPIELASVPFNKTGIDGPPK